MQMQFMKMASGTSNKGNRRYSEKLRFSYAFKSLPQGEPMGSASLMPPNPLLQEEPMVFASRTAYVAYS